MFDTFPKDAQAAMDWSWDQFEPYTDDLMARDLTEDNVQQWLQDFSDFVAMMWELRARMHVATTVDTTDEEADKRFKNFMAQIFPRFQQVMFMAGKKLLDSELQPDGFELAMRSIRAQVENFRVENLPLFTQESELGTAYNKLAGAQTVEWDGEEVTIRQLAPVFQEHDRDRREKAWRLAQERVLADREAYNDLWRQFMDLRKQIAANAGFDNYRDFVWIDKNRFDYTPEDALAFVDAIEKVVVPAAERLREKRRQKMGLDSLRPWDLSVDPLNRDALKPFTDEDDFKARGQAIFNQVDPELGNYFQIMRDDNLLDLTNRKGKAPGGYCTTFMVSKKPFIFQNAVGVSGDVRTLLHEAGHAFHAFEVCKIPNMVNRRAPMEFNEVASMAMELLSSPYWTKDKGGYYDEDEAARARIEHLEGIITFWPYMAVVVAFQHWIYANHDAATDAAACDAKWRELWDRFMKGIDFSGLEQYITNRWRQQLHIFRAPFYYVEYGLAQLGAVQVWANALEDQANALRQYREALALGGTVKLPELYEAAGAKLAFDEVTLGGAVTLIETTINSLETSV